MNKKALTIFILTLFLAIMPIKVSNAALPIGFGGFVIITLPCTCSVNLWIYYTPLYTPATYPGPMTGPLVYAPYYKDDVDISTLYAYYAIGVPVTWELGTFVPGVQACWQYVGVACVPMPNIGLISKVGTSLPL